MDIYIKTRSYDIDYDWLPNTNKKVYSEKWLKSYTGYISQEKPSLIVKRENQLIKVFITDIPSKRKDFSSTSIRYAIAFDVNSSENDNINSLTTIIKAWLYERFNADEKGRIKESVIGEYLDTIFTSDFVNKLMKSESCITNELDVNILKNKCEEKANNIIENDNKNLLDKADENYYWVCNLKNKSDIDSYENINIFFTLLKNNILTSSNNESISGAFFSLVLRLESVANRIKETENNENFDKSYPKFICVDFTDYNVNKINKEDFELKEINESCICLKKKLQKTAKKSNTLQFQEEQIQSKNIKMKEIENSKKSNTIKIIVMALLISIGTNIGTTMKLISQNKQMTVLTTKIQKLEYDKTEVEKINRELELTIQETQSKLTKMEHINQEKEEQLKTLTILKEENQKLKQQFQDFQTKEKMEN